MNLEEARQYEGDRAKVSQAIKELYDWHCVITGRGGPNAKEEIEAAHIEHAGQGGDPSTHTVDNIIPVHQDVHEVWHGKRKFFELHNHKIYSVGPIKYEPLDSLRVHANIDGTHKEIPKDWLWFFKAPTVATGETAWQHYQQVLEGRKMAGQGLLVMAEGLSPIKENEEWRDLGYNSWTDFLRSPEVDISERKGNRLVGIYEDLIQQHQLPPERLSKIDQIKLDYMRSVVDEDNKDELLASAESLSREDFRKEIREEKGESLVISCNNCANVVPFEFDMDFDDMQFGTQKFRYCKKHGWLLESMTSQEKKDEAANCKDYTEV